MARPTLFTPELAERICQRIAQGEFLSEITLDADMPSVSAIGSWSRNNPTFQAAYAQARAAQADHFAAEATRISDDGSCDYKLVSRDGSYEVQIDQEALGRSRLKVDTRKWLSARLDPANYGDKQFVEHSGSIELTLKDASTEELLLEVQHLILFGFLPQEAVDALPAPEEIDPNHDLG